MQTPRLQITPGLRALLDYPRFTGPTRMLILETGYFFDQSWLRAAAELGWEARSVPSVMVGDLTRGQIQELFTIIGEFKPDFILTSNFAGMDIKNIFARFFEDIRLPYVSWFTDTPRMILYDRQVYCSPYIVAATWERAYIPHFEALGFTDVHFMPHATDPHLFEALPADTFDRDLAFVGHSMICHAAEAREKLRETPRLLEAVDEAFAQGCVTRENFALGMDAIVDADILKGLDTRQRRHVELYVVYEATRRQRAAMAVGLEPDGIVVHGDPDWDTVIGNTGGNVGYFDDLAPFYRHTKINLNSTSLQMRSAVNQRVFDCPAGGGFLISDAQADLTEFFDEDEYVAFQTLDELRDKVHYYRENAAACRAIILRAQGRIRAHHTHAHRLRDLEGHLKARFAD